MKVEKMTHNPYSNTSTTYRKDSRDMIGSLKLETSDVHRKGTADRRKKELKRMTLPQAEPLKVEGVKERCQIRKSLLYFSSVLIESRNSVVWKISYLVLELERKFFTHPPTPRSRSSGRHCFYDCLSSSKFLI